jgi:type I restriction enzyme S subunit
MREAAAQKPKFVTLAKVADPRAPIVYGIVQPGPDVPDGVVFIQSRDVGGRLSLNALNRTSVEIAAQYRRSRISPGDILFSLRGKIGESSLVPPELEGANIARGVARIRVTKEQDPEYIRYVLQGPDLQKLIAKNANGSTFREISIDALRKLPIPVPPLPEQRKIAAILGTWDAAIEKAENVASRLDALESLYFRELILEPHSRLDNLPRGWTAARLDELGRIASGGTPTTNDPSFWNGDVPWCTPTEITALTGRFIGQTGKMLSRAGLQASSAEILPTGSLVVCTRATVGACAINTRPMATNQGFKSIIPNGSVEVEYLYFYIRAIKHDLMRLAAGSTFAEIPKSSFGKIRIAVPPRELRQRLIGLFTASEDRRIGVRSMMDHFAHQKRGLMQKLLTGKIRVPEAVADLSPAAD